MSIFSFLFGRSHPRKPASQPKPGKMRHELLSCVVRDTIRKHGIPADWLGAETFPAKTSVDEWGLHLRLVARNGDPKLLAHAAALERAIHGRLMQVDANARSWVAGTSWRLESPDDAEIPELPGPEFWQASPPKKAALPMDRDARRESVSQMLAARDAAFARTTWESPEFIPTEPMPAR